jgi:hypothetical protein
MVMTDPNDIPAADEEWENPIQQFEEMVDNVMRLGFVVARDQDGRQVFVEAERDPTFPRLP